jgi:hypothetical protein
VVVWWSPVDRSEILDAVFRERFGGGGRRRRAKVSFKQLVADLDNAISTVGNGCCSATSGSFTELQP